MANVGRMTDTIVHVDSMKSAVVFLNGFLGLRKITDGPGWVMLEDSVTAQRIVLTAEDFGSDWALSVAAGDIKEVALGLREAGATLERAPGVPGGGRFELWRAEGIPLLLYEET